MLTFPTFGPERRGAPMRAFAKISSAPIGDRSASSSAQFVLFLDQTLFSDGFQEELAEGGIALVNAKEPSGFADARVLTLDADGISSAILGRPFPNTAFLGAIPALTEAVSIQDIEHGIRATMPPKLADKNVEVAKAAYEAMQANGLSDQPSRRCSHRSHANTADPDGIHDPLVSALRPDDGWTPHLREAFSARPADFASSTAFEAGYLTTPNAGWRSLRPVIDPDACTLCMSCYLYCPDGTIVKERDAAGDVVSLAVDLAFCKGCGVCAKVCPADCIQMVPEGGDAA